ncbi:MAG: tRNA pseudouridine(38-40) synthase TruA [Crocinitomicaceae bacterium]|nr:tRNA pseudouridine(38-40) synthase TruA [Crocinitomicaceae bacterium]
MPRYFIHIAYDGTDYVGWQIQPNGPSVQENLQNALTKLNSNRAVEVIGCGRTDAGVHASSFYAHFEMEAISNINQFVFKLNCILDDAISVFDVFEVKDDLHARFDATSRTYHYFIHTEKDPFSKRFSTEFKHRLDLELMNQAGEILLKYDDFTSFSKTGSDNKTTICKVTEAKWEQIGANQFKFTITADRFLRNMVRAVVGTLIEVGQHKMTLEEFTQVIEEKNRGAAGTSMPPEGLFLAEIVYAF